MEKNAEVFEIAVESNATALAPSVRPQRRDSKHDLLVSEARRAFADLGVAGTHIADVAARAGIRKSTFFHYFADKDSLYTAAVTNALLRIADDVDEAARAAGNAKQRIDRIVEAIHGRLAGDGALARLLLRGLLEKNTKTDAGTPAERITARLADTIQEGFSGRAVHDAAQTASSVLAVVCLHQNPSTRAGANEAASEEARLAEVKARVHRFLDAL